MEEEGSGSVAEERLHNQATHFLPNSMTKRSHHASPSEGFISKRHRTLNSPGAQLSTTCLQPSVEPGEEQMETTGLAIRDLDEKTTNARHLQRKRRRSPNGDSNPLRTLQTIYSGSSWRRRNQFSLLLLFFGALLVLSTPALVSAAKTDRERIRWSIEDLDLSTDHLDPKSSDSLPQQDIAALADHRALHIPDQLAIAGRLFQCQLHQQVDDDSDAAFSHYKARETGKRNLPNWLFLNESSGTLLGVPLTSDAGLNYITVDAFQNGQTRVETTFSIEVLPKDGDDLFDTTQPQSSECFRESTVQCSTGEPKIVASMVFLVQTSLLSPLQKVLLFKTAASLVDICPQKLFLSELDHSNKDQVFLYSQIANSDFNGFVKSSTVLSFLVGCGSSAEKKAVVERLGFSLPQDSLSIVLNDTRSSVVFDYQQWFVAMDYSIEHRSSVRTLGRRQAEVIPFQEARPQNISSSSFSSAFYVIQTTAIEEPVSTPFLASSVQVVSSDDFPPLTRGPAPSEETSRAMRMTASPLPTAGPTTPMSFLVSSMVDEPSFTTLPYMQVSLTTMIPPMLVSTPSPSSSRPRSTMTPATETPPFTSMSSFDMSSLSSSVVFMPMSSSFDMLSSSSSVILMPMSSSMNVFTPLPSTTSIAASSSFTTTSGPFMSIPTSPAFPSSSNVVDDSSSIVPTLTLSTIVLPSSATDMLSSTRLFSQTSDPSLSPTFSRFDSFSPTSIAPSLTSQTTDLSSSISSMSESMLVPYMSSEAPPFNSNDVITSSESFTTQVPQFTTSMLPTPAPSLPTIMSPTLMPSLPTIMSPTLLPSLPTITSPTLLPSLPTIMSPTLMPSLPTITSPTLLPSLPTIMSPTLLPSLPTITSPTLLPSLAPTFDMPMPTTTTDFPPFTHTPSEQPSPSVSRLPSVSMIDTTSFFPTSIPSATPMPSAASSSADITTSMPMTDKISSSAGETSMTISDSFMMSAGETMTISDSIVTSQTISSSAGETSMTISDSFMTISDSFMTSQTISSSAGETSMTISDSIVTSQTSIVIESTQAFTSAPLSPTGVLTTSMIDPHTSSSSIDVFFTSVDFTLEDSMTSVFIESTLIPSTFIPSTIITSSFGPMTSTIDTSSFPVSTFSAIPSQEPSSLSSVPPESSTVMTISNSILMPFSSSDFPSFTMTTVLSLLPLSSSSFGFVSSTPTPVPLPSIGPSADETLTSISITVTTPGLSESVPDMLSPPDITPTTSTSIVGDDSLSTPVMMMTPSEFSQVFSTPLPSSVPTSVPSNIPTIVFSTPLPSSVPTPVLSTSSMDDSFFSTPDVSTPVLSTSSMDDLFFSTPDVSTPVLSTSSMPVLNFSTPLPSSVPTPLVSTPVPSSEPTPLVSTPVPSSEPAMVSSSVFSSSVLVSSPESPSFSMTLPGPASTPASSEPRIMSSTFIFSSSTPEVTPSSTPAISPTGTATSFSSSAVPTLATRIEPSPTPTVTAVVPTTTPLPQNTQPVVVNPIGLIIVREGQDFQYQIPESTFYDQESGSTSALRLSLLDSSGNPVSNTSWIQLTGKIIEGIPLSSQLPDNVITDYVFVVRAEDSMGSAVFDLLTVRILPQPELINFLVVYFTGDFQLFSQNLSERLLLVRQLESFGAEGQQGVYVRDFRQGSIGISYNNLTISDFECEAFREWVESIYANGAYTQTFLQALDLFQPLTTPEPEISGPCGNPNYTIPPTVPLGFTPATGLSSHLVIFLATVIPSLVVALCLSLVGVAACLLYRRRIEERKLINTRNAENAFLHRTPVALPGETELPPRSRPPTVLPRDIAHLARRRGARDTHGMPPHRHRGAVGSGLAMEEEDNSAAAASSDSDEELVEIPLLMPEPSVPLAPPPPYSFPPRYHAPHHT